MDILAAIDAAVGCQQCEGELTVSNDFCSPDCQRAWHAERAVPLPWAPDAALVYVGYDAARWRPETEDEYIVALGREDDSSWRCPRTRGRSGSTCECTRRSGAGPRDGSGTSPNGRKRLGLARIEA